MLAKFYTLAKKRNSTLQPAGASTDYDLILKAPTSLESPTVIIKDFNPELNYCQFNNTYFFVNDVIAMNNDLFEVSLIKDVLATYKTEIGNYTAFVDRSENNYNSLIIDGALTQTENIISTGTTTTSLGFTTTGTEVWKFIGKEGLGRTPQTLQTVSAPMFESDSWLSISLQELIKANVDPYQYIVSGMWFPVSPTQGSSFARPGWNSGALSPWPSVDPKTPIELDVDVNLPENAYSDFRKYSSRYSKYTVYIPTCGTIDIDASDMALGLHVKLTIDIESGRATAKLTNGNGGLITIMSGVGGIPIHFGKTLSPLANIIQSAASVVGDLVGTGVSVASGSALGAVTGALGTVTSVIDGAVKAYTPPSHVSGNIGSIANIIKMPDIIVTLTNFGSGDLPVSVYGRPCCKTLLLSSLSGFIKCANASIALPGHADDTDAVNAYLNTGFYME